MENLSHDLCCIGLNFIIFVLHEGAAPGVLLNKQIPDVGFNHRRTYMFNILFIFVSLMPVNPKHRFETVPTHLQRSSLKNTSLQE